MIQVNKIPQFIVAYLFFLFIRWVPKFQFKFFQGVEVDFWKVNLPDFREVLVV